MIKQLRPKPPGSTWTDRQWQAIASGGQDILVAAAAGSGKTAVLVERIIQQITDEVNPLDVDRLLVVTFTEAAAAEMRLRIGEALEKQLTDKPDSVNLKRQLTLINRANISTFHAFCLSVIRRYYYLTNLDPAFRIADDTEIALLQEEILEDLFEEEYQKCEEASSMEAADEAVSFYQLVDCYSTDRSDLAVQQLVLKLYDFARSTPWPIDWLTKLSGNYRLEEGATIDNTPWAKELLREITLQLQAIEGHLVEAKKISTMPGGPAPYLDTLAEDLAQIQDLVQAAKMSWEALYTGLQQVSFGRLKSIRGTDYDEELKRKAKNLRDQVKKQISQLIDTFFLRPPEAYLEDMRKMTPVVERLIQLVITYGQIFQQVKQERGLVDYSDLEHYCLAVLLQSAADGGQLLPSQAALEYRRKFREVLVDEYQDTNMVQETILSLITGGQRTGNLFMVGDVKQSIYRFRLAEPELFLAKYKAFQRDGQGSGLLIDLAQNFRSRREVLDGTNFIFKQIMDEAVGEIAYDQEAELVYGAKDYPDSRDCAIELLVVDSEGSSLGKDNPQTNGEREEYSEGTDMAGEEGAAGEEQEQADLEVVELEARLMADKIKALIGAEGTESFKIYDKKLAGMRPIKYRDIVILLRASKSWAPAILEEFKRRGIPAYAELSTGYFAATEVAVVMSLLKVIDNPYQDIPLASVLRSTIVGLTGDQLAEIRLLEKQHSFYRAVLAYLDLSAGERNEEIYNRLNAFKDKLTSWRTRARQGALADLIWEIYRETGYFDFVAGMPGGNQRQANLTALYHRARQYEATSFRGLFRFLRFIERLQERGGDFGAARSLGEQEDVVRVITIHKSKGLEFPVVFVAGMGKQFNLRDLHQQVLLHKQLGFGTRMVDPVARISSATLPQLAIKERLRLELLAEEMRLLYVALTRAKEKLFLIGTVKDFVKEREKWRAQLTCDCWLLPDLERAACKSYLDWVGRALVRHRDGTLLDKSGEVEANDIFSEVNSHPSRWHVAVVPAGELVGVAEELTEAKEETIMAIKEGQPVAETGDCQELVTKRLNWSYGHLQATQRMAKQTVTEIKRHWELSAVSRAEEERTGFFLEPLIARPKFLQQEKLSSAEKGTAMHQVMQHLDFTRVACRDEIEAQINAMVSQEILTREQAAVIETASVSKFFQDELGKRLLQAPRVEREIPFSLTQPTGIIYRDWVDTGEEEEQVLVQGVIDCVFFEHDGLVLLDYKTDTITGRYKNGFEEAKDILAERYRIQIELYCRAIEAIWRRPVTEKYLYFFDGGYLLKIY